MATWIYSYRPDLGPSACNGPKGPCNTCRAYLDRSYNPRHVPTLIGPVFIGPALVSILSAETKQYSGDTEEWHTEIVGFIKEEPPVWWSHGGRHD